MKRLVFCVLLILCLAGACALSEDGLQQLVPQEMTPAAFDEPAPLYCGPTQGFYRLGEEVIDLSQPFVCFGQYDCWTMVAPGTPQAFGPVGWIEGGLFDAASAPELSFEGAFAAMIEEDASVTNAPFDKDGQWAVSLPRGTQVTVLAALDSWLYVQTEIDGVPARVFVPAACIL